MVDVEADEVDVTGADSVDVTLTFNVRWREFVDAIFRWRRGSLQVKREAAG